MEQLLTGDVTVITVLSALIVGIFTKRIVPWWIHEEALNKLEQYEKAAPNLLEEVNKMMQVIKDEKREDAAKKAPYSTVVINKKRKRR